MIDLSASELLRAKEPEAIFCRATIATDVAVQDEYKKLALLWHPDRNRSDEAEKVFAHITSLRDAALDKLARGLWTIPGLFDEPVKGGAGKRVRIHYKVKRKFELGDMLIGDSIVAFIIDKQYADLYEGARRVIRNLKYPSKKVQTDIERSMPAVSMVSETNTAHILVVKKTPDLLLLSDVIDHYGSSFDPKHVAWVVSTLLNLACYLKVVGLTHNAIASNSYFISPQFHSGALLGGWWYAAGISDKLIALPKRSADAMSISAPDHRLDLELIRATAREMLGDATGTRLSSATVPQPMLDWIRLPSNGNAVDDYRTWKNLVLPASFGPRKFVEMKLTAGELYSIN